MHVSPFPKTAGCRNCGKQPHHSYYDKQNQKRTTVLHINSDMLALNTNSDGRETVRPAGLFQPVNPRVPPSSEEVEHVLEGVQPPLTLAQRMGLVDAPPELLCSEEWARLKAMSNQRQDSALPCPICHEPFGLNQQVNSRNYNVCRYMFILTPPSFAMLKHARCSSPAHMCSI